MSAPQPDPGSNEASEPTVPHWDESVLDFYTLPAETRSAPRASILLLSALLLIALVGRAGLSGPFVWDDRQLATTQVSAADGASEPALFSAFITPYWGSDANVGYSGYYRPVANLSFELDRMLWQDEPYGFHLTNLVLHLIACALFFGVAIRLGAPPLAAGVAMLLFGIAPRLTESFVWISGRTDVLASVFVLLALYLYREEPEGGARRYGAALCLFLGMLAKEVALAGVAAITAFELARLWQQRSTRNDFTLAMAPRLRLRNLAPIWSVTVLYLLMRGVAVAGQAGPGMQLGIGERLSLVAETIGRYAWMILDPLHPMLRIGSIRAPRDLTLIAIGLVALGLAGWIFKRAIASEQAGERVGAMALAVTPLVMVLHLVPIGSDVVAADRFLYLPLAGIGLYLAIAASWLSTRNARLVLAGSCVIAASFAWSTTHRAEQWNDELVLWHHASLEADPYDSLPDNWIGTILLERGHPSEALQHLQEALRIEHDMPGARPRVRMTIEYFAKMSRAMADLGRYTDSLTTISQATMMAPEDADVRAEHALALARLLRFDEARAEAARAIALPSPNRSAHDLARAVLSAREHWLALPPLTADEARNLRIARGDIFAALGATRQAESIWLGILDEPDLSDRELLQAARFLTFHASPDLAAPVIARLLSTDGPHQREARALSQVLEERRQQRARQSVPPALLDATPSLAAS